MQLVKLLSKTSSKTDMAQVLIRVYAQVKEIKLNKSETEVLSYLIVYGISKDTKNLIVQSGILKSLDAVANAMSELKNKHLLERVKEEDDDRYRYKIIDALSVKMEPMLGIVIKIDNR